jgi:hypothetical protein
MVPGVPDRAASHHVRQEYPVKKLALEIEQLQVDSYETTTEKSGYRGTVHGNSLYTNDFTCVGSTCGSPSNAVRCKPPV